VIQPLPLVRYQLTRCTPACSDPTPVDRCGGAAIIDPYVSCSTLDPIFASGQETVCYRVAGNTGIPSTPESAYDCYCATAASPTVTAVPPTGVDLEIGLGTGFNFASCEDCCCVPQLLECKSCYLGTEFGTTFSVQFDSGDCHGLVTCSLNQFGLYCITPGNALPDFWLLQAFGCVPGQVGGSYAGGRVCCSGCIQCVCPDIGVGVPDPNCLPDPHYFMLIANVRLPGAVRPVFGVNGVLLYYEAKSNGGAALLQDRQGCESIRRFCVCPDASGFGGSGIFYQIIWRKYVDIPGGDIPCPHGTYSIADVKVFPAPNTPSFFTINLSPGTFKVLP